MPTLAWVFSFKIAVTVLFWCLPLILFPASWLLALGLPPLQPDTMFARLLGWAYLSLCVGYGVGLQAARQGRYAAGPVWVGIVSNGGACLWLAAFGLQGHWHAHGPLIQLLLWSSVLATAAITIGLYAFGVRAHARGDLPASNEVRT